MNDYPLVLPNPGAIIRQSVDEYLASQGFSGLEPKFETVALPVATSLLRQSNLLWFISRGVVDSDLRKGNLMQFKVNSTFLGGAVGVTRKSAFEEESPTVKLMKLLCKHAIEQRSEYNVSMQTET